MLHFLARRLFYGLLVMAGVVTLVFFLFNVLPGDPARMMMGQRADLGSVEAVRKEMGLDQPLGIQYLCFLNDLSPLSIHTAREESAFFLDAEKYTPYQVLLQTGSGKSLIIKEPYLRRSYQSRREVSDILAEAFPMTLLLAVASMLFATLLGVLIGTFTALYRDTWFDRTTLVVSVLGMSLPSFFAAIIMAWIFAFLLADITGLPMVGSLIMADDMGEGEYFAWNTLILPALTLGIRPLGVIVELTRSSLLEVMGMDYIRTAYAKGLSKTRVIVRHALRNALNPIVTAVSGWFASLMAGAVFVEYVFDWKGVGVVIVDALDKYDFPVVMGAVLFIAVILVLVNIFVDIIYALLDPRVRLS
ncbi:MAG: ABC transporter permease [Lentimicrobiaceae bacterium]|nr:ABC transporter permease [Lentimicrobiaceae bacterium]